MQSFMVMLLTCSVTMSALAMFYMAVTPLLSRRYSAKWRYYAWLAIVVGLIIPFRPQFNNAIVRVDAPNETTPSTIQIGYGTPVTIPSFIESPSLPSALPAISWWQVAAMVWLMGMVAFLVYHGIKHYRFMKMTKRWIDDITDEHTLTLLQGLKSEMGISKQINAYQCSSIGSPMMIGHVNTKILLPRADLPQDELVYILKHELVHYKRKDLWYKTLVLIATAIHWFNPIVCLMAKAIDTLCELSCDAEVVRNADADTRQQYSETIIGVVRYQSKLKTSLSTNFYGGKKGMQRRIFSIMYAGKNKAGIAIICCVLLATLGTGFAFGYNAKNAHANRESNEILIEEVVTDQSDFVPEPAILKEQDTLSTTQLSLHDVNSQFLTDAWISHALQGGSNVVLEFPSWYTKDMWDVKFVWGDYTVIPIDYSSLDDAKRIMVGVGHDTHYELKVGFPDRETLVIDLRELENNLKSTAETDMDKQNPYAIYEKYGLTYNANENKMYYDGQIVRYFIDRYNNGQGILCMWAYDLDGTVDLYSVRNNVGLQGELIGIEAYSQDDFNLRTKEIEAELNNTPDYDVMTFRFKKDEAPDSLQLWIRQCEADVFDFSATQQNGRYYIYARGETEFGFSVAADGDEASMQIYRINGVKGDGYALFSAPLYKRFNVAYNGATKSFLQ